MVAKRWIWGLWIGVPFVVSGAFLLSLTTTICKDTVTPLTDCPFTELVDKPTFPWAWGLVLLGVLVMTLSIVFLFVAPIVEKHSSSVAKT